MVLSDFGLCKNDMQVQQKAYLKSILFLGRRPAMQFTQCNSSFGLFPAILGGDVLDNIKFPIHRVSFEDILSPGMSEQSCGALSMLFG